MKTILIYKHDVTIQAADCSEEDEKEPEVKSDVRTPVEDSKKKPTKAKKTKSTKKKKSTKNTSSKQKEEVEEEVKQEEKKPKVQKK